MVTDATSGPQPGGHPLSVPFVAPEPGDGAHDLPVGAPVGDRGRQVTTPLRSLRRSSRS
jgi:hypothetical protein